MNKRKWRPTSKSRKRNLKYSNSKNIRGWNRANENFEIAMTEKNTVNKEGHVYIISLGFDNLYKVGKTISIERRLKELRASNPLARCVWSAWVRDMKEVEKKLHSFFKVQCIEREIFRLTEGHIRHANNYVSQLD